MSQLPNPMIRRVRARYRCEYCQSLERYVGEEFTIDHIIPRSRDGTDH
ncbi:HNH endonuclease [Candidatus Poribacteria bacterium]|nr:HNH endonuclease [Candidatus Poribacteria bacterium]